MSTARGARRYRVEHWVRSNLRSHGPEPFHFEVGDSHVEFRLPHGGGESEGFIASVLLTRTSLPEAERDAHDLLTGILNLIAFEFKMPALVEAAVRSHVEESGEIRHCAIYSTDRRPRRLFLMDQQANEIQRLLEMNLPQEVVDALYWLRWSYLAERGPEAFLFAWMALERLVGDEDRQAVCRQCGNPVVCPEHGAHTYRSVSPSKIKEVLARYEVGNPKALLDLRHPLVHGSLKFTFEKRAIMSHGVPRLWKAVEGELGDRLAAKTALDIPGGGRTRSLLEQVNCEYRTSYPAEPFPTDCPTYDDVQDYKERIRQGQKHPKIVNLLAWPPNW